MNTSARTALVALTGKARRSGWPGGGLPRPVGSAVAALIALTSMAGPAGASTVSAAGGRPPGPALTGGRLAASVRAGAALPRAGRPVLLITGTTLAPSAAGAGPVVMAQPGGGSDPLMSVRSGQRITEIPADAAPYLGHGLDPRLFDLAALQRAEQDGRLPVRITFAGHQPQVPGVRVTRPTAGAGAIRPALGIRVAQSAPGVRSTQPAPGVAWGYLTTATARAFGAALRHQFMIDHRSGRYGEGGLFGHGTRIWLAGAAAAATPGHRSCGPADTLTVHGTNLAGQPDTGDAVQIFSLDGCFITPIGTFHHGIARFRVHAGHYWMFGEFFGGRAAEHLVFREQFTVAGNTTEQIAEAAATSKFVVTVPRPTLPLGDILDAQRNGPRSSVSVAFFFSTAQTQEWVNPTTVKPTLGSFYFSSWAALVPPRRSAARYQYDLGFPAPEGIIRPQIHRVTPADLATVDERSYQDQPARGALDLLGQALIGHYVEFGLGLNLLERHLPFAQTTYFTAGHNVLWQASVCTPPGPFFGCYPGDHGDPQVFTSGQHLTEDWNNYPLHPAPNTSNGGPAAAFPVQVSADRTGNALHLAWTPFSDNQPGHTGESFQGNQNVTQTYTVRQNGTPIAHGSALTGIPPITLSAKPATIGFTLTTARSGQHITLSTSSRTTWTWRSARDTGARVPAGWYCSTPATQHQLTLMRRCAVQSLMTLAYDVQGLSPQGLTQPGPQVILLTAGHIQLAQAPAVASATAQISLDGGNTWTRAKLTSLGHGRFRITFNAPAHALVSTRITATDAAGNAIAETITNGYAVAP